MDDVLTNDIPSKQVRQEFVALLRARCRTYQDAKLTYGLFVLFTIAFPVTSVLFAPAYPQLKECLALAALVLLLLDVGIIDRLQKDRTKRGAKLQEEFDVKVFGVDSWPGYEGLPR